MFVLSWFWYADTLDEVEFDGLFAWHSSYQHDAEILQFIFSNCIEDLKQTTTICLLNCQVIRTHFNNQL